MLAGCSPPMGGVWKISAACPPQSQYGAIEIAASANAVETEPGVYKGTITNNLGQRGEFESRLEDDKLRTQTVWEGLGPTNSLLVYSARSNTFEGIDSNGCSVRVRRP